MVDMTVDTMVDTMGDMTAATKEVPKAQTMVDLWVVELESWKVCAWVGQKVFRSVAARVLGLGSPWVDEKVLTMVVIKAAMMA